MPEPQGLCEYGGFTNIIGGEYTMSRGVQPGVFRLRTTAELAFPPFVGPLRLRYGAVLMEFEKCATGPHLQRSAKGRARYQWSIKVYDKRWRWRYARISGHYNVRNCDGSFTRRTLRELLFDLLDALGEFATSFAKIPEVYPEVRWDNAYAARELESLCDWAGLVICPQLDGVIRIELLGSGQGLVPRDDNISPVYTYNSSVKPSLVELRTGPTVYQSIINLEAVGLDTDGSIKRLNSLSYMPNGGWSSQWYTNFPGVAPASRHLAFQSVWRWYRLHSQAGSTGNESLDTMNALKIMERLAETHEDDTGVGRCPEAVVRGVFWPLSDLKVNTLETERYSGSFKVIPELNLIAFDYPVIKWTGTLPDAATLKIYVAYKATAPTGEYINEVFVQPVSQAIVPTAPRVEKRHYLKRVRNFSSPYGVQSGDNLGDVTSEALAYLGNVVSTYAGGSEIDMEYDGLVPINLSGRIAQVQWRWGNYRIASTRASENHEFDVTQKSHQARRRDERLGQLYDLVKESQ